MELPTPCEAVWNYLKIVAPMYHVGLRQAFEMRSRVPDFDTTVEFYSKRSNCQEWSDHTPDLSPRVYPAGLSTNQKIWHDWNTDPLRQIFQIEAQCNTSDENSVIMSVYSRSYDNEYWHRVFYLEISPDEVEWNDVYHRGGTMSTTTGCIRQILIGSIADVGCARIPLECLVDWHPAPDLTWIVHRWRFLYRLRLKLRV